jgi:hypothetical protein
MWAISAMLFLALGAVVVWSILRPRPTQTIALNLNISTSERGNASKPDRITINSDVAQLRLSLRLPENEVKAAGYRVALVNPDGSTQDISIDKVFENVVVVNIDATKLTSNTYALQLSAIDENKNERRINGSYFFEVVKS